MSDFDFACSCDSYSYPFYERCHTARKEHRCYDCSGKILPGQWYMAVGGLCEGEWWNGKICRSCWSAMQWVKAHIPCLCVSFGNMREELIEICREAQRQAPGLLFGLYRRLAGQKIMPRPTAARNDGDS
jgi:hypothetical protein